MPRPISYAVFCLKKKKQPAGVHDADQKRHGEVDTDRTDARTERSRRRVAHSVVEPAAAYCIRHLDLRWTVCRVLCRSLSLLSFFFHDPPTTEIYTLSLHDALPILLVRLVVLLPFQLLRLSLATPSITGV